MRWMLGALLALASAGWACGQDGLSVEAVKAAQKALAERGYAISSTNGAWSVESSAALKTYQRDWRLSETGVLTEELAAHLAREHPGTRSQFYSIENARCTIWNPSPSPQEKITWTGGCVDGKAEGDGYVTYRFVRRGQEVVSESPFKRAYKAGAKIEEFVGDDSPYYDGAGRNGRAEGQGVFNAPNQYRYDGAWKNGRPNGQGVKLSASGKREEGQFENGVLHGRGILLEPGGTRYEGEFDHGDITGTGVILWANGVRYEGGVLKARYHGQGVLNDLYNERYEGGYQNGKREGFGVQLFRDGSSYEGEWEDDMRDGQGVEVTKSGNRKEGQWYEDQFIEGKVDITTLEGTRYVGDLKNGKQHGQGKFTFTNGSWYEGAFKNGYPDGEGTYHSSEQNRSVSGRFEQGCIAGKVALFRPSSECGF